MGIDPAVATVAVGALALIGTLAGVVMHRLTTLERRVAQAESYNRRLWAWARRHLDLYYRHRTPGSPDPEPIPEEGD